MEKNSNGHPKTEIPQVTSTKHKQKSKSRRKSKQRDKTDLGPDFVAPDGGWGWVVCLAAGFSSFCVFTPVQQYGIIYRQRMYDLGFEARQITTIINSEMSLAALTGIINGALFRRFTYRQAALAGGVLVFVGILLTAFCRTFWQYFICFSSFYGIGLGMNLSATAPAVNTYFKNNRRRAMGFSTTITGLGPILLPYICTLLLQEYGTQGTILLVAAFSLNTLFCGSTLHPVRWHVKPKEKLKLALDLEKQEEGHAVIPCRYCQNQKTAENGIFAAHVFTSNDEETLQCDIIEPGTPMLSSANDGWFGSKTSLSSMRSDRSRRRLKDRLSLQSQNNLNDPLDSGGQEKFDQCTCAQEMMPLQKSKSSEEIFDTDDIVEEKVTLKQKIIKFFDLDLLTDLTFVNIMQGMTVMMFCELNFSFLTPFILNSYGYNDKQISLAMSLLASVDIIVRFTAPFALEKVKLSNNLLFAIGIVIMLMGRIFVTIVDSFYLVLTVFLVMGFGKGLRTIFAPLLIPSYVPLERLPGASGLQLFSNAIFTMAVGPVLGLIADISSYTFTIHLMNLMTVSSLMLWITEYFVRKMIGKKKKKSSEG